MSKSTTILLRLASLIKRSDQVSAEVSLQEKLRWHADRVLPLLGWPGILAIGLLVMSVPFYFSTVRPLQSSLESMRQILNSARDPSSQTKVDHSLDTPTEQLAEFYKFFPPEKDSPRWLGLMMEIANRNDLILKHGEYVVVRDSVGQLRRFRITLPVQGTYPQIRKYLAALIADIPSMSLENVQFERKDIVDTSLQAKIKLVLYLGQGS